jgi:hypothetical protein
VVDLYIGVTRIGSGISQDGQQHRNQDHLKDRIPMKTHTGQGPSVAWIKCVSALQP